MGVEISVVIPAYNRPDFLRKAAKALEKQTFPASKFEAIIVYGHSSEVEKECKKISKKRNFSCYKVESESPSKKRNFGIMKAAGEIIAFTDDDCVPDPDWLEQVKKAFAGGKSIAGVEGLTYTSGNKELYGNAPVNLKGGLYPTCNIAYRKNILEKINGFDESYHFYREDSDLAFRAMDFGKIIFCGKARVFHPQRKVTLLRPIETVFLAKEEIRLMKKMPEKYWKFLGTDFNKEIVKSGLTCVLIAAIAILVMAKNILGILGIACYLVLLFLVLKRQNFSFSAKEFFSYSVATAARAILLPVYFGYYWIVIK